MTTAVDAARSWHALSAADSLERAGAGPDGLTAAEAARRLAEVGPNVVQRAAREGALTLLWRQVGSPLVLVLIGAGALALALGKIDDGLVVLAVVVLNTLIGFVQEHRAGKAIDALSTLVPETALVLRDGAPVQVPAAEIVPGDVVQLASGDRVPADMRLLAVRNLRVEEGALTGESVPAEKRLDPVAEDTALGDRSSMVFGGTLVTYGTATALVVATGGATELGRISSLMREATHLETPLTRALGVLGRYITLGVVAVALVMLVFGVARVMLLTGVDLPHALRETVVFAIALAVGAIPEGLPAIMTIALAIGVRRMAARRAVIRKLPAVETLGSTTVICTDKTGTLTRNEMTVLACWTPAGGEYAVSGAGYEPRGAFRRADQPPGVRVDVPAGVPVDVPADVPVDVRVGVPADVRVGVPADVPVDVRDDVPAGVPADVPADVRELLEAAALCNDAALRQEGGAWKIAGDPTEGALVVAAEKAGIATEALRRSNPRVDAIPFESENQFMATAQRGAAGTRTFLKGAPEQVFARCERTAGGGALDASALHEEVDRLAARGLRVLAIARRDEPEQAPALTLDGVAGGFTFLGLAGMIDPPRPEAVAAVAACNEAGIAVKMITGDHRSTAEAIGRQIGLAGGSPAVTGLELAHMDEPAFAAAAREGAVFARVAPEHKLRLVRALQQQGQVVAMTGDGVNDAPALKQADIGVAMGITGTAAAKDAAEMVLVDDNFATIVGAVEEGRRVYDNLVKSLAFVLPTNLGLALILLAAVLFFPFDVETNELLLPIAATQLLWINLVATVALALPLAFEAHEPDLMRRRPRPPGAPVLSGFVVARTLLVAALMAAGAVALFLWEYLGGVRAGLPDAEAVGRAQTMAVTTVILFQIFYVMNCRALRDSVFRIGLFSNRAVFVGIGVLVLLQAGFIYLPPLNRIFGSVPLAAGEIGISAAVAVLIWPIISLEKLIRARWRG